MNEPNAGFHAVQIYTGGGFRWSGTVYHAAHRRLSDFINDATAPFLNLEQVTLSAFSKGVVRDLTKLETAMVTKRNIIAVVTASGSVLPPKNVEEHVAKIPQRMMIYAPPFAFVGNLYFTRNANWVEALNGWKTDFLSLTDASTWSLDSNLAVSKNTEFLLVNRLWTVAIHPQGQAEKEPSPQAPVPQRAAWTRLRDVSTSGRDPKENRRL
jgi:hypothetical protein